MGEAKVACKDLAACVNRIVLIQDDIGHNPENGCTPRTVYDESPVHDASDEKIFPTRTPFSIDLFR